jgi:hypothetical protein
VRGGSGDDEPDDTSLDDLFEGREWRTGTSIDHYTPLYRLMRARGISQHDVDRMDITNVALELGLAASGVDGTRADDQGPVLGPDGQPVAGTAPVGIKPPAWWRGNRAAYRSSTRAMGQLRSVGGGMDQDRPED